LNTNTTKELPVAEYNAIFRLRWQEQPPHLPQNAHFEARSSHRTLYAVTVYAQDEGTLQIKEGSSEKIVASAPRDRDANYTFAPDRRTLLVLTRDVMRLLDAHTLRALWQLNSKFENEHLYAVPHFPPQGLVGMPDAMGFDFFDARTGNIVRRLRQPALAQVSAWNFSPDGSQLWWAAPDGKIFWCALT